MTCPLPAIAEAARVAGNRIMAMQAEVIAHQRWKYKRDGSIVTDADQEAHELVLSALRESFPGVPVVSEESPADVIFRNQQATDRFETDPIDNTAGYARGLDGYSVNIGRIVDGAPVAGAVYFPAKGELFYTGEPGEAWLLKGQAEPVRLHTRALAAGVPPRVAIGYTSRQLPHVPGPHELFRYPAQYRTMMVATGDCDVTGLNHPGYNTWDVAGSHAVLRAAGGEMVSLENSRPLRYGAEVKVHPHVAGSLQALRALNLLREE